MNYNYVRFSNVYTDILDRFVAENPDYEKQSYAELRRRFDSCLYDMATFSRGLANLGNAVSEFYANVEPLQKAWARENNVRFDEQTWMVDVAVAQMRHVKPDVIYLQDLYAFNGPFRERLRAACDGKALMLGWRSAPTDDFSIFKDLDAVFTGVPNFEQELRKGGANAFLIPLAFEPAIVEEIGVPTARDLALTFAGSLYTRDESHVGRRETITHLLKHTPLEIWTSPGPPPGDSWSLRNMLTECAVVADRVLSIAGVPGESRKKLPLLWRKARKVPASWVRTLAAKQPDRFHAPVFGKEYYSLLARSRITLNIHVDCAGEFAGNLRMFEATGMGACLVTDWKRNLADFFEPDHEVVACRSAGEYVEKVRYLLDHDDKRCEIAEAGRRRTLRDHSTARRAELLDDLIKRMLKSKGK